MRLKLLSISFLIMFCIHGQNLRFTLDSLHEQFDLMGWSVLFANNDSILLSEHGGYSDIGRHIQTSSDTKYRIASVSKMITATALMILYDERKCELDSNIENYLNYKFRHPDFPEYKITLRMLLSHTSGLIDGGAYSTFLNDTYAASTPPKIAELLTDTGLYYSNNLWNNYPPGKYFEYSNLNYGVIATIIEILAEERFDVFCKQRIFNPLGINASFNIHEVPDIDNLAVLYRKYSGTWYEQKDNYLGIYPQEQNLTNYQNGDNGLIFSPHGGLRASAEDLGKIIILHLNNGTYQGNQLFRDTTCQMMRSVQWLYNGSNGNDYYGLFKSWGLGLHLCTNTNNNDIVIPDFEMMGHPGEAYGLVSDLYFSPNNNFGLVFITNGCGVGYDLGESSAFYKIEEEVFKALNKHIIQPMLNSSAIDEVHDKQPVKIFGNRIYISENIEKNSTVCFYDYSGKILLKKNIIDCNSIDISNFPKIIIWKISGESVNFSGKILNNIKF